ncbi:MAG TPA: MFS transporter [Patescibacteria group bacterium]
MNSVSERATRHQLPIVILTLILDYIGFAILIPIGPLLFTEPSSPHYLLSNYSSDSGYILFGLLVASYPLAQFLAAPVLGQLSDRYGRKPVLSIALVGTMFSYILFALGIFTANIPLLFFSRILDGITGANVTVAQASLADITEPQHRSKVFGYMGASIGVGITLGPLVGGKLSDPSVVNWFNSATPFWFAAILSFLNVLSVQAFFVETLKTKNNQATLKINKSFANIVRAFSLPNLRTLFTTSFLFGAGFAFYTAFASVFLVHRFGFDQSKLGNFFFYTGMMVVLTQAFVPRLMATRFSERQLLRVSLIAASVFPLLYVLTHVWWCLLLIFPFYSAFVSLSMANITSLVSKSAKAENQGEVLGINTSVQGLAQSIPPILGGIVAAQWVYFAPLVVSAGTLFLAGVVFLLGYKSEGKPNES